MILELHCHIVDETAHSTLSNLYAEVVDHDGCVNYTDYLGIIIEDGHRDVKVPGHTRIPAGRYPTLQRRYGKFYDHAHHRWHHDYVLEIADIPGYTDVLLHWGNTIKDTSGCPLINTGYTTDRDGNYVGIRSQAKYRELHEQYLPSLSPDKIYWNVHRG